jgi:hypothetical protein
MCTLKTKRLRKFEAQKGRCFYCDLPMWEGDCADFRKRYGLSEGQARWLRCTAEHLVARCDGGRDEDDNIVAACRFCNAARHRVARPRDPAAHRAHIAKRLRKGGWHPAVQAPALRRLVTGQAGRS